MCIRGIHVLTLLACMLSATPGRAQIENLPISEEVTLDKVYLGLLTSTQMDLKEWDHAGGLSLQAGTRIRLVLIPRRLHARSFGVLKIGDDGTIQRFTNFEGILTPANKLTVHVGVMATPTTELRPNPSTWQSQVETHAESTLPGGRPGARIKYALSKHLGFAYGIHHQQDRLTHHLQWKMKHLKVSGYWNKEDALIAAKWSRERTEIVSSYRKESVALSAVLPVFGHYGIYADVAWDASSRERLFSTWGLRRYFSGNYALSGFFFLNYNHQENYAEGGFFLHI